MDKETLSNYGWIVILVLILSVLLALATPFGNFVAEGFKAVYTGLFDTSNNAIGIIIPGAEPHEPNTLYYYQPYKFDFDDTNSAEVIFHEDGAVDIYYKEDGYEWGEVYYPGDGATYGEGTVEFVGGLYDISEDGTQLLFEGNVVATMIPTPIHPLYMNTDYIEPDGEWEYVLSFNADGSGVYKEYYQGEEDYSWDIATGVFKYFDEHFEEHYYDDYDGQTYIERQAVYPNGTKIISYGNVYVLACTHPETEIRNKTDNYTGDTYCKVCNKLLEKGEYTGDLRFGLYQPGAISKYEAEGEDAIADMFMMSWEDLVSNGIIEIVNGQILHKEPEGPAPCSLEDDMDILDSTECGIYGDLIIPVDGSITGIMEEGFRSCGTITGIYMPDNITYIGPAAFCGCSSLNKVRIGNNVSTISEYAFAYSYNLNNINIPQNIKTIEDRAFDGTSLTTVTIPQGITNIGTAVFANCEHLASISVSSSNTRYHVVQGCLVDKNTKSIIASTLNASIPSNSSVVTIIGDSAFEGNHGLGTVTIPNNIVSIGTRAFENSSISKVVIPSTITKLSDYMFSDCYNIVNTGTVGSGASIEIPNSVTEIGQDVFSHSWKLTSVNLPNSVKTIGASAFAYCSNLEKVIIPNSVTSIGDSIFRECRKLSDVTLSTELTSIPTAAFIFCYALEEITIPEKVTTIGGSAFSNCTALKSITIPKNVTYMGTGAFYWCRAMTEAHFEVTTGWGKTVYHDGSNWSAIDVSSPTQAAKTITNAQWQYIIRK